MFNAKGECDDADIRAACKDLVFIQCWPHICRKVQIMAGASGDWCLQVAQKKYVTPEGKEWFIRITQALHGCRTEEQFERMSKVGMKLARSVIISLIIALMIALVLALIIALIIALIVALIIALIVALIIALNSTGLLLAQVARERSQVEGGGRRRVVVRGTVPRRPLARLADRLFLPD